MIPPLSFQTQGKIVSFDTPHVMGILNVTPDSFFDGGNYQENGAIQDRISGMLSEGAHSIDIGGMSTKPGSKAITVEVEWNRIKDAIGIALSHGAIVSVDTVNAVIAKRALAMGVHMINDISAGLMDADILPIVAEYNVIYIAMHMQGRPDTMQVNPVYTSVTLDVLNFFAQRIAEIKKFGIDQLIIDPGFGFGKSIEHNYALLDQLSSFQIFDYPVLVGMSRKSMIYKVLDSTPENVLPGTLGLTMVALQNGAQVLRVHDVAETVQVVKIFNQLKANV